MCFPPHRRPWEWRNRYPSVELRWMLPATTPSGGMSCVLPHPEVPSSFCRPTPLLRCLHGSPLYTTTVPYRLAHTHTHTHMQVNTPHTPSYYTCRLPHTTYSFTHHILFHTTHAGYHTPHTPSYTTYSFKHHILLHTSHTPSYYTCRLPHPTYSFTHHI